MPYRPSPEAEAIVAGQHGDPFAFLGMHKRSAGLYVRAFLPDAEEMAVVDAASGEIAGRGERIHPAGLFVASLPEKAPFRYRLRVLRGGHWHEFDDIYRFPPVLCELDIHLLVEGNHLASYRKLLREVRALDPDLALYELITMQEQLERSTSAQMVAVTLVGVLCGLALLLAAIACMPRLGRRRTGH